MEIPCLPPVPSPSRPRIATPTGACDTHFHIFGPSDRFPYAASRAYTPPDAPLEKVLAMHDALGIARGVAVQGNAHGTDNAALVDALKRSNGRLRGVAIVPPDMSRAALRQLVDAGVRALRFHHISGGDKAAFSPLGVEAFLNVAPTMAELDLHLQMMLDVAELDHVLPRLAQWKHPVVLDHYGLVDVSRGVGGGAFQTLRRALADGAIWLKLSAPYRISKRYPDYEDVRPLHEALVEANPDQVLWGTDWPHPRLGADMPDDGHLLDVFNAWTPDAALRQKILVTNPAKLYGFA